MASSTTPSRKTVLVTGANGYIGFAVCRAFNRAGWRTYGLVRRVEAASALIAEEIIPIIGSISKDATWVEDLHQHTKTVDVVVSCTEQFPFAAHYEAIAILIRKLAEISNKHGVRPLVLASSGCKDYGTTGLHGSPGLAPHTEDSPLHPMDLLSERCFSSLRIFEHKDLFDAAVIRPTPVFGYDSSYYGMVFELAAAAAKTKERSFKLAMDFNTITHGCHIDDCGEAYLALAEHADRSAITGQCFNISAARYDTLAAVAKAMEVEYGLTGGVVQVSAEDPTVPFLDMVLGYSQWVDSTKIRKLTGWSDKRMLLSENLHVYRMAYEEAAKRGHEGVLKVKERIAEIRTAAKMP
ncbi:NAD(P)-binding protein [Hypomontagnella submonticulosa]|nr:NAD(P)-binding protein [Hypomontagnella submonticulosa]